MMIELSLLGEQSLLSGHLWYCVHYLRATSIISLLFPHGQLWCVDLQVKFLLV